MKLASPEVLGDQLGLVLYYHFSPSQHAGTQTKYVLTNVTTGADYVNDHGGSGVAAPATNTPCAVG